MSPEALDMVTNLVHAERRNVLSTNGRYIEDAAMHRAKLDSFVTTLESRVQEQQMRSESSVIIDKYRWREMRELVSDKANNDSWFVFWDPMQGTPTLHNSERCTHYLMLPPLPEETAR